MNNKPLVSIIIPVYNREKIIKETLDCAIAQTYENIEIIICDNKSTDNTWAIVEDYAKLDERIRIYRNDKNVGPILNWKVAIEKVKGDYIKILWSDDLITPDFITKTLPLFDDSTAYVITGWQVFDEDKVIEKSDYRGRQFYKSKDFQNDFLFRHKYTLTTSPGCILYRTEDLKSAFIMDVPNDDNLDFKILAAGNDLLMVLLPTTKYKQVKLVNSIEAFFRSHSDSLTVANELSLYYEWAKLYFIKQYRMDVVDYYKCYIKVRMMRSDKFSNLYKAINGSLNVFVMADVLFRYVGLGLRNKIRKLKK